MFPSLSATEPTRFEHAWAFVQRVEGGFTIDQGGPTMGGVTQVTFDRWLAKHHQPVRDVRTSNPKERGLIAWEEYWLPSYAGDLPAPLDLLHFDAAFNSDPGPAIKMLQRALHVRDDGNFGPLTRAALKNNLTLFGIHRLAVRLLVGRMRFYAVITQRRPERHLRSLAGWVARLDQLAAEAKLA